MTRIFKAVLTAALIFLFTGRAYSDTCNKPFPQNVTYPFGIKPNNYTNAEMNAHVQAWFDKWKAKYLTQNNCTGAEWRVQRTETGNLITNGCSGYATAPNENDTVSEGIGYGMVVLVYMSSASNNTKAQFDGLYTFYKNHLDGAGLMNWQLPYCTSGGAATDADEDVAAALLMAEAQWGNSTGTFNYGNEATTIIGRILANEITAANDVRPGDGWDFCNPSYFAPYEYRMFADKTGVLRWDSVATRSYQTFVNYYYNSPLTTNSSLGIKTGLQPNWCNYDGTPASPGAWAMRADTWWWDAIRHAWRQGYDYVLYGTSNSQLALDNSARLSYFFKTKYAGNPSLIKSHYTLDGTETFYNRGDRTPDLGTEDVRNLPGSLGAVAIAAMAEGDQAWLNALYDRLVNIDAGTGAANLTDTGVQWGTDYFCDLLKMQYLLILTGNMPNPMGDPPTPTPTRTFTFGPSPTNTPVPPPGMFDDFETGALVNPDTSESNGDVLTITNSTEQVYTGARALKGVTTGGTWAVFSIDSPYTGGLGYRNYTGATAIEFDIYCPAGKVFFVEIEEAVVTGVADGERFSNRGAPTTKAGSGWSHISLPISSLTRDSYSPVMGNNTFNLAAIQSFLIQFEGPGTMTFYVDNVQFTGTFPTATPTRTATRTRTPAGTLTNSPTRTATATNSPYYSPTRTPSITVTRTETLFISPTITRTATITPTWTLTSYIPVDVFDDFETGALMNPSTADTGGGATLVLANSGTTVHAGTRSMSAVMTGTGWAVGSIDSPYDGGLGYRNFTGATGFSFWIYTTSATGLFVKIVESNGQQWSNRGAGWTTTGTGWQQINLTLSTLTVDDYSPAGDGDGILDLNIIKSVQFQWDNPGTKTVYIDDIRFTGMPVPTSTRTPTRTPSNTRTPTYTRTGTRTPTYTATPTATRTDTMTANSPTPTATMSHTASYTRTWTFTATGTYTRTLTGTPTATAVITDTFTGTATGTATPSGTRTGTRTITQTYTRTASPIYSPTLTWTGTPPTDTVTPTYTRTWTNSATPTVTGTYTRTATATATCTITRTGTQTRTGTPTWTETPEDTPTHTPTVTRTDTGTGTPTLTGTPTFTATPTASPTFTGTSTPTFTISTTHSVSPTITQTITGTPPTDTVTPTITESHTNSPTATITLTSTPTSSATASVSPNNTFTKTPTSSVSNTPTNTASPTYTRTYTGTATPTATATATRTSTELPSTTATPPATITASPVPTLAITATATPTEALTGFFEIVDPLAGPNPHDGESGLYVYFNPTRACDTVTLKVYTNALRLVRQESLGSCNRGPQSVIVPAGRLSGLAGGTYFYVITGESQEGKAHTTAEKLLVIKK